MTDTVVAGCTTLDQCVRSLWASGSPTVGVALVLVSAQVVKTLGEVIVAVQSHRNSSGAKARSRRRRVRRKKKQSPEEESVR